VQACWRHKKGKNQNGSCLCILTVYLFFIFSIRKSASALRSPGRAKSRTGLIATLTALVLGLLVSSAKSTFDQMSAGLTQGGAHVIFLDRTLASYGPESKEARDLLRSNLATVVNLIWPEDNAVHENLKVVENRAGIEKVADKLRTLTPKNDSQRLLQTQALQLCSDMAQSRWLIIEQSQNALPTIFLVVLYSGSRSSLSALACFPSPIQRLSP
jgi:hypothetical protein